MSAMSNTTLIVWGGWDGHTPRECADLFAPLLQAKGHSVELAESLDAYLDRDKLMDLSLIVPIWTMGELNAEQEKNLLDAVASGVGLAGFHGGLIDSFRGNTKYQWMTGGQFVAHPGDIIPTHRVTIADHEHEITAGLDDFDLPDSEQYYMHVDPGNEVLATTTYTGEHGERELYRAGTVSPYAWTRPWGSGRVFCAAWGHTYKDFDVPEAREIVLRGMLWAARA